MKKTFLASIAAAAATMFAASGAGAVTFEFDGNNSAVPNDAPVGFVFGVGGGNGAVDCGTVGVDICSIDDAAGFRYAKDGVDFTAKAFLGDNPTLLIQDLVGPNQGLGAFSEWPGSTSLDQINVGESLLFDFTATGQVFLSDIYLNDGLAVDCPGGGGEGPCGDVLISIDGGLAQSFSEFLANGILGDGSGNPLTLVGTTFEFFASVDPGGYSIEQFSVSQVPVPAALPLLISGLAGLGFASRRRKKTA
ncbi:MAG: VPLPA-CTERM sorting domain-containing protein [Pseudomonadota bacterium]